MERHQVPLVVELEHYYAFSCHDCPLPDEDT